MQQTAACLDSPRFFKQRFLVLRALRLPVAVGRQAGARIEEQHLVPGMIEVKHLIDRIGNRVERTAADPLPT